MNAQHVAPRRDRTDGLADPDGRASEPDTADIFEIHPLLHRTLAATRSSWQACAEVTLRLDAGAVCVRADAREVVRACMRAVVETARVVAERDGGLPARRRRVVIATSRHAQRVEVSVSTDGFRHVLHLAAVD